LCLAAAGAKDLLRQGVEFAEKPAAIAHAPMAPQSRQSMLTSMRRRFCGLFWPVATAVLAADIFVVALAGLSLRASYQQYWDRAALTSQNTARLVSQSVVSEIGLIDMALKAVQDEYAREYASGGIDQQTLRAFLKRQIERLPMASAVRMTDANGIIVLGADDTLPPGVSVGDRDYFLTFQKTDYAGTFIARPVFARVTLRWVMNTARRLSRPDGSFDGVVYVQVPLDWFNREFAKLDVGPEGVIGLRGDASRNFVMVARYPEAGFTGDTNASPQLAGGYAANPGAGKYTAIAGTDKIERIFSYQQVGDYPLIIVAGLSIRDTFAGWWSEAAGIGALAGLFCLLTTLGGWQLLRAWNTRQSAYRKIRSLNEALEQDIAARKTVEETLRRHEDQLEEAVRSRTSELLLACEAAETASKAKSAFLANTSHELRTPLNAILGFSCLLRREPDITPGQQEKLDIINRAGEHLLTLINNVLEMAKIEARRLQLESAPLDLTGLVRDIADMMQLRAKEKGLQLLVEQSSGFPRFIKGDEARLRQILVNLAGNAVKFTQEGSVTIRLRTRQYGLPHLIIEVEDTGPGIGERDQARLFQPFTQFVESGTQKGTGLGLAISRQLAELMGGCITVDSQPGKGSIFRVVLPAELAAEATAAAQQTGAQSTNVCGLAPGQPAYRILIAEDQPDNRLLLTKLMTSIGLETRAVENGQRCVETFREWHPHLIWMDGRMPVMDGIEAMRAIRAMPEGKETKIVAVTASVFGDQRQKLLDAGMDGFIRKPYRFDEIYASLAQQLGVKYVTCSGALAPETDLPATLEPEMVAVLPEELCQRLAGALKSLDSDSITAAISEAGRVDAGLARILTRQAENFDYPAILRVIESTLSPRAG
jgi:signal transduction histidine kinase/DNA-binding NarL/FixJ family response regulator